MHINRDIVKKMLQYKHKICTLKKYLGRSVNVYLEKYL